MNPVAILEAHAPRNDLGRQLLLLHSEAVAAYALKVADRVRDLNPDFRFIEEAALLHDIGVSRTDAPDIGCEGTEPYIAHGLIGAKLLRKMGYPRHGDVCERHIGVGLTGAEIVRRQFPLPPIDIVPVTLEEQIITYVDNFFSKGSPAPDKPGPFDAVRKKISTFGEQSLFTFDDWVIRFGRID
jgi:uncharacterized protein